MTTVKEMEASRRRVAHAAYKGVLGCSIELWDGVKDYLAAPVLEGVSSGVQHLEFDGRVTFGAPGKSFTLQQRDFVGQAVLRMDYPINPALRDLVLGLEPSRRAGKPHVFGWRRHSRRF
jgi:hypothetical protein